MDWPVSCHEVTSVRYDIGKKPIFLSTASAPKVSTMMPEATERLKIMAAFPSITRLIEVSYLDVLASELKQPLVYRSFRPWKPTVNCGSVKWAWLLLTFCISCGSAL